MKIYSLKYRILNYLANKRLLNPFNILVEHPSNKIFKKIPIISGIGKDLLVEKEQWMSKILSKLLELSVDKTFIDVGVNLGQTLIKVKEFNPNIDYIGFEPNPNCIYYLNFLTKKNKIKNTKILPCAISNETKHFELLLDNSSLVDSSASIIPLYRKGDKSRIDIIGMHPSRINALSSKRIGCIKIDVEGAEMEVLDGLKDLVKTNFPFIICEILPVYNNKNVDKLKRQIEIERFVKEVGYFIYRVDVSTAELALISDIGIHSNIALCNYIFSPKELNF